MLFSRIYLYGGGVILTTTVIIFTYKILFGELFNGSQYLAAVALAITGVIFMAVGHDMYAAEEKKREKRRIAEENKNGIHGKY